MLNKFLIFFLICWMPLAQASYFGELSQPANKIMAGPTSGGSGAATFRSLVGADLPSLPSAQIYVGNGSNVATAVAVSNDLTLANTGAFTIANNAVTNAKLAQMATHTFKGNNTGGTANALDLTATQLTAELNNFVGDSGAGGTKGLVPAPAAGDAAASKFLKADGTWATASGSASSSVRAINAQTGTSYTFALTDGSGNGNNPLVTLANAATVTATVPTNASVAFPIGTQIDVIQDGAGAVVFAPAGGVTINSLGASLTMEGQFTQVSLIKTGTNTWDLVGATNQDFIVATGGTIVTSGNFKIHTFNSSGTFQITAGFGAVDSLVVAGGGGGGGGVGGGGGAGGFIYTVGTMYGVGSYTVTVGAGGAGGVNVGSNGSNSVFDTITATGGGGGGQYNGNGSAGGSGGGAGGYASGATKTGGAGTGGQGNNGGDDNGSSAGNNPSAGGGGAGAVGQTVPSTTTAGNGGAGVANSISGASVTYAGGGGGCTLPGGTAGTGGAGGGGNGVTGGAGSAGTANTGGGGGCSGVATTGANGGSGVVIVRYQFQ